MMIPPTGTGDLYAAAAAFDRQLRSSSDDASDATSGSAPADSSPDVVVTFSQGASMPATYGPSGKLAGAPSLDDLGANGPDSLAHASESVDGVDASVDQVAAVPA